MRAVLRTLLVGLVAVPVCAFAADEKLLIELNTVESTENRCKINLLAENKAVVALDSMKLDLVLLGTDGGVMRRLIMEMGPIRPVKTVLRAFLVDAECRQIGAILVNDVTACVPGEPDACLDGLGLSSRLKGVRLYKLRSGGGRPLLRDARNQYITRSSIRRSRRCSWCCAACRAGSRWRPSCPSDSRCGAGCTSS